MAPQAPWQRAALPVASALAVGAVAVEVEDEVGADAYREEVDARRPAVAADDLALVLHLRAAVADVDLLPWPNKAPGT